MKTQPSMEGNKQCGKIIIWNMGLKIKMQILEKRKHVGTAITHHSM